MSGENNKVPKLRFPEFRGEWDSLKLGDIAAFSKGKGISKADIDEDGALECIRYGQLYTNYSETIKDVKSRTNIPAKELVLSEANDIIIPASGETQIDIATASCVLKDGVALGGDLNIVKTEYDGVFLSYYLNSTRKYDIARLSQGISVVHLYAAQLKTLHLNLPVAKEQQKIASFLSAIDSKIAQITKKKALLEQYKRGAMQKLFSQEFRFKDAQGNDFPDWEEKKIGDFIKSHRGGAPLRPSDFVKFGNHPVFPKKYIVAGGKLARTNDTTFCSDDFFQNNMNSVIDSNYLITTLRDLVPSGPTIGYVVEYSSDEKFLLAQGVYGLKINENQLDRVFFIQFSNTHNYRKWMKRIKVGSTQVHIRMGDFKSVPFSIPSLPEQQKIADFLSSIDRKIDLVTTELDHAKTFKKGLLQQMFI